MADAQMDAALANLKARYIQLVSELEAIKGDHVLNQPEVKIADGGTALLKTQKIKQLEESIERVARAIKRHNDLCAELEAGPRGPFVIETQMEL